MADHFTSEVRTVGELEFPRFTGTRVMMMPFDLARPYTSIPASLDHWREAIRDLVDIGKLHKGIAYLTIDEAMVAPKETHRRSGLHVDGVGADGSAGGWGGGGGGWGAGGMLLAASHVGCRAWVGEIDGWPGVNGDCAHLAPSLADKPALVMQPNVVYWAGPLAVHESIPMTVATPRQFARLSMPSDAPWYEGYTRNPLGIEPTGEIHPARAEFMAHRVT